MSPTTTARPVIALQTRDGKPATDPRTGEDLVFANPIAARNYLADHPGRGLKVAS